MLNPVQRELLRCLGLDPDDPAPQIGGLKLRKRILKARREGMSTILLALYFLDTYNNANRRSLCVAHDLDSTQAIFEMVQRFFVNLPAAKKRPAKRSNRRELYWEDIDSGIFVATAGRDNVGSGSTLHNVLKSERAKWPGTIHDIRALDASIDEAGSHANIIEETTAYGMNHFFTDWNDAVAGNSIYEPLFFPWFEHPDYVAPVPMGFVRTAEETARAQTFNLSDAQLAWYRQKSLERRELMPQEYPHTPNEAFVSSGNPYFDRDVLMALNDRMHAEETAPDYAPISRIVLDAGAYPLLRMAVAAGNVSFWKLPNDDDYYIVTADPAGGVDTDGKRDYCSADVLNARTWEQVAHIHGRWEPHAFGLLLAEVGWLYNEALVGVLRLNHGHAVLDALLHTAGYPAQRGNGGSGVYYYDATQVTGQARPQDARVRQAGWPENSMTKPYMLDKLGEALLSDPGIGINCRASVAELLTYVHLPGGQAGGEAGSHDDRVSSLALGAALLGLRFERHRQVRGHELKQPEPMSNY